MAVAVAAEKSARGSRMGFLRQMSRLACLRPRVHFWNVERERLCGVWRGWRWCLILGRGVLGRVLRRRVSVEGRVRGRRRVVGVNILLGRDWVSWVIFCVVISALRF
ncbi:hypothetical protein BDV34DRAFT_190818 [Aspergillus parasiticus]|uniref:Uncharacterized protein n=1 Tax=Aspergillus parasiticus TaxID=5067 RepID=A0A5N6DT76_ASPPA|nr:hypothetical protein BDV34DRAFT_190818 [Aspergillus parasiticus]